MKISRTEIDGVLILEPLVFEDERGYFFESFSQNELRAAGIDAVFVQDNQSCSTGGVIRGLHYQLAPYAQAKIIRALEGMVLDVAVDLRPGSPTFGRHVAVELSGENNRQVFIPHGFAHGFSVLSERAVIQYKCDAYYAKESEAGIRYDDPALAIDWRIAPEAAIISEKDGALPTLENARLFK